MWSVTVTSSLSIAGGEITLPLAPVRQLTLMVSAWVTAAGCFAPVPGEGLPCSAQGACPTGQHCDAEGVCVRGGATADAAGAPVDAAADVDAGLVPDAATSAADATMACAYACTIDVAGGTTDCASPMDVSLAGGRGLAVLDLGGYASLDLTVETCSPTGWSLHLADSPSCDGYSGDGGQFSNDAEVQLLDTTISVYGSQDGGSTLLGSFGAVVPAGACAVSTWRLADGAFAVLDTDITLETSALLRIDPPSDSEGAPDARWYLGLNRTYGSAARLGTGVTTATLCFN